MAPTTGPWFTAQDSQTTLVSVQNLNQDREAWKLSTLAILEDEGSSLIDSVSQSHFDVYCTTRQDIEKRIITLIENDSNASLASRAASRLYLAGNAFRGWESGRRSGPAKMTASGLQSFLCTMGEFLQSFSGIAEIVKGADQQYGGLAYGTISLLLSVAIHKQRREEAIEEALEELSGAFPRLETLQRLGPKDSLRTLIVDVFELVILFSRETIDYFAKRTRRLKEALKPQQPKPKTLLRLRTKLTEIRRECEIMMLEELADMSEQLKKVRMQLQQIEATGDDTNFRVREGQAWMEQTRLVAKDTSLAEIKETLGLKRPDDGALPNTLKKYKSILNMEFADHRRGQKIPRQMTPAVLNQQQNFAHWKRKPNSSMLLLGGSNWLDDSSVQLNWLSYASLYVIESAAPPERTLFFLCQTDYHVGKRKRKDFTHIVLNLIYELVVQETVRPSIWRQEISDAMKSAEWLSRDPSIAFEAMSDLLAKLIAALDDGTRLTIVIDRLDQCTWTDPDGAELDVLDKIIGCLLDLVQHEMLRQICVKVLVVMDEAPARDMATIFSWAKGLSFDWKTDWNQEVDDEVDS